MVAGRPCRLSAADQAVVSELVSSFTNAQVGLLAGASAGLAVFSGCFAGACLTGTTAYPRWCAAANPLLLFALLAALGLWLPAVGLVTIPAGFNLALTLFYSVSLLAPRGRQPDLG